MRGSCPGRDVGPFGRHCQDMAFRSHGPCCDRFNWGPPRPYGPPGHCPFGTMHPGPRFCTSEPRRHFGHRGPFFGWGHFSGEETDHQDSFGYCGRGFGRGRCGPGDVERVPHGPPGFSGDEQEPRRGPRGHHSPDGRENRPCHGPRRCREHHDRNRDHCKERRNRSRDRSQERGRSPGQERHHEGHHDSCHGPPRHHGHRHCGRRGNSRERRPNGHCGPFGPFGPHFGPRRRPFGLWNRMGPYDRCPRNCSDEESGNETERRGRKNRHCGPKNKDQNREETVLVQRIVVEKLPRCSSI